MRAGSSDWRGQAQIGPGLALFVGHSGDNRMHQHLAHQISLADPGTRLHLELPQGPWEGEALWVRAGTPHRVRALQGLILWVDPTHGLAEALIGPEAVGQPRPAEHERLRALAAASNVEAVAAPGDARLTPVLARLRQALARGERAPRGELARASGLSAERFSHWFSEQTGMPLRSYRKWLRLQVALEQALGGHSLTDAAHAAGFADQAHFARTLRALMGVSARQALRAVQLR